MGDDIFGDNFFSLEFASELLYINLILLNKIEFMIKIIDKYS